MKLHLSSLIIGLILAVTQIAAQEIVIVDNDDGAPAYTETGTWATSGSPGYEGRTYRHVVSGDSPDTTFYYADESVLATSRGRRERLPPTCGKSVQYRTATVRT